MIEGQATHANHPLAIRMGVIAFIAQAVSIGCMFGSIGLMLAPIEARLGINRAMSSLAVPLVGIGMQLLAPVVGILANKISLRLLLIIAFAATAAGYAILAVNTSFIVYVAVYGLLIGPCMAGASGVLPSTLVTRWFIAYRGRALGFLHMPVGILVMPPLVNLFVEHGLTTAYLMLAGVTALALIPILFIVDAPPATGFAEAQPQSAPVLDDGLTIRELMRDGVYWVFVLGLASVVAAGGVWATHLVPMMQGWGFSTTAAASLFSLYSAGAMVGTLAFGWIGDKFGGRVALLVLCLNDAVLWGLLLTNPPHAVLIAIIALIGMHSGSMPVFGLAISERYGRATFSRAFGLGTMACLPFSAITPPLAGAIYEATGSYSGALVVQVTLFAISALLIFIVGSKTLPHTPALQQ